jgi:hypothetical protein
MPAAVQAHGSSWHKIDGTAIAWFLSTLIATLHMLPRHLPIRARLLLMGLVFMTPACSTYSMRKENVAKKKPASLKKQAFYEQCLTESIRTVYLERLWELFFVTRANKRVVAEVSAPITVSSVNKHLLNDVLIYSLDGRRTMPVTLRSGMPDGARRVALQPNLRTGFHLRTRAGAPRARCDAW